MQQLSVRRRLAVAIVATVVATAGLTFVAVSPAAAIGPSRADPSNPSPPPLPPVVVAPGPPSTVDPYDPV
jgi:hypothetical protein